LQRKTQFEFHNDFVANLKSETTDIERKEIETKKYEAEHLFITNLPRYIVNLVILFFAVLFILIVYIGSCSFTGCGEKQIFVLLIISAYLFYQLRLRLRILYGFAEVIIGFVTIYYFSAAYSEKSLTISEAPVLLAGIYIIIRGLDNMTQFLITNRFIKYWNYIFMYKFKSQ